MRTQPKPPRFASGALCLLLLCALGLPAAGAGTGPSGTDWGGVHAGPAEPGAGEVERRAWVMGTEFLVRVRARDHASAMGAAEAALRAVEEAGALLSTWAPDTPLSALNRAPVGRAVRPAPDLAALLGEAERWARDTGRAFEPAVGALVTAWDLRGEGRRPGPRELAGARAATGPGGLTIVLPEDRADQDSDEALTFTRRDPAAWLDSGGFGKGAALRRAADRLREHGATWALLNLGGQILVLDTGSGSPHPVDVADPRHRDRAAVRLSLRNASVATSGQSERWREVDGERLGHILDPRSGAPVDPWGSVTVLAPDPVAADVLSTALYVMGPEDGLAWARTREDVGVLVLRTRPQGPPEAFWNAAMNRWLLSAPGAEDARASEPRDPSVFHAGRPEMERDRR